MPQSYKQKDISTIAEANMSDGWNIVVTPQPPNSANSNANILDSSNRNLLYEQIGMN